MIRRVERLPPDWVRPHWLEEQRPEGPVDVGDRSWTTLGNLGSSRRAVVDQRGLVTPWSGGWSLDWWIGADDRWHFPSRDSGVRQRLVDATPVVETAMRIPGGDAVHRCYVVRAPGPLGLDEWLVVEIHNATSVPFALAFAVRPYHAEGVALVRELGLVGSEVTVNGRVALLLPGRPRLVAGSTLADGDAASVVAGGGAVDALTWPVRCPAGLAQAAFVYPLAHTVSVRVAMPMSPDGDRRPARRRRRPDAQIESFNPARLPSAAAAARAWQALTSRGLRFGLPPGRLADAVEANRRHLLLFHTGRRARSWPEAAIAAVALDRYGFHDEAAEQLAGGLESRRPDALGSALWGLCEHWRLSGDTDLIVRLAPAVARSVRRIRPARHGFDSETRWVRRGLLGGADLLLAANEDALAATATAWAGALPPDAEPIGVEATARDALCHLQRLLDTASPTWTWPEGRTTATEFCSLVRNLMVREVPGGLALLTPWPDSWSGQALEIRSAPTHAGVVSYAVRWHGDRPALLWELRRHGSQPARLSAPGLDPSWHTDEPAGETLLSPRRVLEV